MPLLPPLKWSSAAECARHTEALGFPGETVTSPSPKSRATPASSIKEEPRNAAVINNEGSLARSLSNRKTYLLATGSSIGTALFLSRCKVLIEAGPADPVLGLATYSCFVILMNN